MIQILVVIAFEQNPLVQENIALQIMNAHLIDDFPDQQNVIAASHLNFGKFVNNKQSPKRANKNKKRQIIIINSSIEF